MIKLLSEISSIEPKRAHGNITDLKRSIASDGLINPLTIDENGNLLAGRRRYQAVKELDWMEVEVKVLPVNGDQLKAYAISLAENLQRKDITEVEKAISIKEFEELKRKMEGEAERHSHPKPMSNFDIGWTQAKTAEALHVSRPTVNRSIKIATAVEEYPELAKYRKGASVLKEYAKKERQKQSVKPMTEGSIRVILGDMKNELVKVADNSVSLILTDPPYPGEFLPSWQDLARISARILKPSGFLVAYSGQLYLDKVMQYLSGYLAYYWLSGVKLIGAPSHRFERNIQNAFKPILIYQKPPLAKQAEWLVDLLESPASDKKYHDWGQSEAPFKILIQAFSNPGDLVVDPFCGGGVMPYLCRKLGRQCLAIDNDQDAYNITLLRLRNDQEEI